MTLILWMVVFVLGYQLLMPKQGPKVPPTDLYQQLKTQNFNGQDVSAATTFSRYEGSLNDTFNAAKQTIQQNAALSEADKQAQIKQKEAERDEKVMEARVLLADTQYKAAVHTKDLHRVILAFDALQGIERSKGLDPIWTKKFRVAYHGDFKEDGRDKVAFTDKNGDKYVEVSPAQLKQEARDTASSLGKNTPVWGFFPGYDLINFIVGITGRVPAFSYALACFLLALFVRAVVFPLSKKQMIIGRRMSQLTPLAQEIKDQYKTKDGKALPMEKQQEMNQRVMALYQEYGLNPFAGCLPALLQMPLFFLIYQSMLHYRFEFEKGTFLWINPAVGHATNGFLGANLGQKDYVLIVVYGISMLVTTWLQPVSDPTNAKQQRMMGMSMALLFAVMMFFWPVPSAFVLYWVFTNILATAQSLWIYKMPMEPLQKVNTSAGGRVPSFLEKLQQQAQQAQQQQNPGSNGKVIVSEDVKTGTPQQHKPKKKKK